MNEPVGGDELQQLLIGLCEGELDISQRQRLVEILRGNANARLRYTRHMTLHARLERELEMLIAESAVLHQRQTGSVRLASLPPRDGQGKPASPVLGFLGNVGRQGWGYVSDHSLLFSALAVLLLVAALVIAMQNHRNPHAQIANRPSEISDPKSEIPFPDSPSPIVPRAASAPARLVRGKDCHSPGPEVGQALAVGQPLSLASGVAEIEFAIGAKVILQSPATLELLSPNSARLEIGKATVEITSQRARGFKLVTPETAFVDQGTEFGVEVAPGGASKIHVFRGVVDVDRGGPNGPGAPWRQRLLENAGARMERGEEGMTLVEDTGECFIRSLDEADRDRHTVAYWRFEDRPVGTALPHSFENKKPVRATTDSTFNGNDLFTFYTTAQPRISGDVPAGEVPQTGAANRGSVDNTSLSDRPAHHDLYTDSGFSHAAPLNLNTISPAQWTIEASLKAKYMNGAVQTFVGRDGADPCATFAPKKVPPRLAFQITAGNRFAIRFVDGDNRTHQAVAARLPLEAGHWYNLAATSDGRSLRLYVDLNDGRGYRLQAETALPNTGSTALGNGPSGPEWSVGRGCDMVKGGPGEWFEGWIDEVRISDVALEPAKFLFAPKEKGKEKGAVKR